jgi:uncharacterized membrane protein YadS
MQTESESTSLLEGSVQVNAELIDDYGAPPLRKNRFHEVIKSIPTWDIVVGEDFWTCYIGFIAFIIIVPIAVTNSSTMPAFTPWLYNLKDSFDEDLVVQLVVLFLFSITMVLISFKIMKKQNLSAGSVTGFFIIFSIALLCKMLGANRALKSYGLGDSVWAILAGAFITNLYVPFGNVLPEWFKSVITAEFYIKISVVLLAVDLSLFVNVGYRGLMVTWIDTPIVTFITFLIGWKVLRLCREDAIVSAGGLAICGSSAATAISSSVKADKKTAPLTIAIMSFFTVPLIPLMPFFVRIVGGINERAAGAWAGGSVDSTGAVIATAALMGQKALETAAICKMMQNILIGPFCLALTVIWTKRFNPKILWERFPKFVLGFIVLSCVISVCVPAHQRVVAQKSTFVISEWFSTLGFVCIGLDLNLKKVVTDMKGNGAKFIVLYMIGQTLDLLSTFGWAYLSFSVIPN